MAYRPALLLIALICLAGPAAARDYFVAPRGADANDGLTPATAMQSLAIANRLRPGDILRLQRGGTWRETLRLPPGAPNRPIRVTAYGGGELPTIDGSAFKQPPLAVCIDASASYVIIDSLRVTHAAGLDRGAIMVWANTDLAGITIRDCQIVANAGRGIWIAGEAGKSVKWVLIDHNQIAGNGGSGVTATKIDAGWITGNDFTDNCSKTVDFWQAAVRVWSSDVRDLLIAGNHIDNGIHHLDRGAGMGVHVDETGPGVVVSGNDIRHCDAAGVEVENTRGVTVSENVMFDVHTGVHIYRAGHDHRIIANTIVARSQGIVLQGLLAHGVDAGPEIVVDGQLLTGNVIERNIAVADQWGSLKLIGGGERLAGAGANIVRGNAFGVERACLAEVGNDRLDTYAAVSASGVSESVPGSPPFANRQSGDLRLAEPWGHIGAAQLFQKAGR